MNKIISNLSRSAFIGVLLFLVSCGGGGGGGGNTPSNPTLPGTSTPPTVSVSDNTPTAGTTFTVTVVIPSGLGLTAAQLEIDYDRTIMDIDGGTILSGTNVVPGNVFSSLALSNYQTGDGTMLLLFADGSTWSGTNGTLCTLTFRALLSGSTTINFTNEGSKYCTSAANCVTQIGIPSQAITVPVP